MKTLARIGLGLTISYSAGALAIMPVAPLSPPAAVQEGDDSRADGVSIDAIRSCGIGCNNPAEGRPLTDPEHGEVINYVDWATGAAGGAVQSVPGTAKHEEGQEI